MHYALRTVSTGSNLSDSADCTVTTNAVSASRIRYAMTKSQTAMGAWQTKSFSHWRSSRRLTGTESRKATVQRRAYLPLVRASSYPVEEPKICRKPSSGRR